MATFGFKTSDGLNRKLRQEEAQLLVILSFGPPDSRHDRVLEPRKMRNIETAIRKAHDRLWRQISADPDQPLAEIKCSFVSRCEHDSRAMEAEVNGQI